MIRSLRARRWVTGISIVMLLLCQTAAAGLAYGKALLAQKVEASMVQVVPPCHDVAQGANERAPGHGCQDRCPSRDFSPEVDKSSTHAANFVTLPMYIAGPVDAATFGTAPDKTILSFAAPPPLRLVYCRLLN